MLKEFPFTFFRRSSLIQLDCENNSRFIMHGEVSCMTKKQIG